MPDICYSVSEISKSMHDPRKSLLIVAKRILRYIKGTIDFGLLFPNGTKSEVIEFIGYSDSDWCGDLSDRRSTSGYVCSSSMMQQYPSVPRSNQSLHSHHVKLSMLHEHFLLFKAQV